MTNVLSDEKKNQILTLGGLGWPLRRIEEKTGVRRETAGAYLRAAGMAVRGRGRPEQRRPSKPATTEEVSTDSDSKPAISGEGVSTDSGKAERPDSGPRVPGRAPNGSACEPFRELIEEALHRGRNAMAIYQDLVDDHGFQARYSSVKRFVQSLRGGAPVEALQSMLAIYGYGVDISGTYDATTRIVVEAFQRHFRPARVDGVADRSTIETLHRLLSGLAGVVA